MQRETTLGRVAWIVLLLVLGGYVVADFASTPFLSSRGSAALQAAEVSLWTPMGETGEAETVVQGAAADLELAGHPTVIKSLSGGSSQAVADFFLQPPRDEGNNLLVITSATLADVAHDRRDQLIPGAAEQAVLAAEALRRSTVIGIVESEPIAIGVAADSSIDDPGELVASLREASPDQVVAIADDTWSRVELAVLVDRARVNGNVNFSVFGSGGEAGQAVTISRADVALGTHSSLREYFRDGRLREIRWPFGAETAPRFWVALVAAPDTSEAQVERLRGWIGERGPVARGLIAKGMDSADRLELLSQSLERG